LVDNSSTLIQNPFGNYSIQTAVDVWKEENVMPIIKQFYGKFINLSMQKFSSNVVEKFLLKGGEPVISKYIEEISINNRIVDLMKNNYGNYVVQKALKLANNVNKNKLVEVILRNLEKIGDKKLIHKWKSIVQPHTNEEYGRNPLNNVQYKQSNNDDDNCINFNNNVDINNLVPNLMVNNVNVNFGNMKNNVQNQNNRGYYNGNFY